MGTFYGIGIGPGDSELVTVKAVRILQKLDILYTPEARGDSKSFALAIAEPYLKEGLVIKQRHFPMVRDRPLTEAQWKLITEEIISDVKEGKEVGFITLGDPMVFSTYSYLLEIIGNGIDVKTIPGISSYSSTASELGLPLARDEESFAIVSATAGAEKLEAVLRLHETAVIMKAANHLFTIVPLLEKHDLLDRTMLVSHSSTDRQIVRCGISDLSVDEKLPYFTTMVVKTV